jgi:nitrite reductase/ring-hydroxylating ferredoxin subunit
MPDTMAERAEEVSTAMSKLRHLIWITLLFVCSCDDNLGQDQIPIADFQDVVINLTLPEYRDLNRDGTSIYLNRGGLRGLILYRENASSYIAFERTCSYLPNEACANVEIHSSTLYMTDPCCGSTFQFPNGQPTSGPARFNLRIYETQLDGNVLTITDNIAN